MRVYPLAYTSYYWFYYISYIEECGGEIDGTGDTLVACMRDSNWYNMVKCKIRYDMWYSIKRWSAV
jgi:hypothetical protein